MSNQYSSVAVETALTGAVNAVATTLPVGATTGFPASTPYTLVLDAGTASEELVSVTGVAGLNLTVTRGYDGTSATTHQAGAAVVHCHSAKDFKDSRDHEAATAAHGATGAVVGTTNAQTLTNKTVALGSNTVSGSLAEFNTALTGADFATLAGTETLTNKTLTSPTINSPTFGGTFTVSELKVGADGGTLKQGVSWAVGAAPSVSGAVFASGSIHTMRIGNVVHFNITGIITSVTGPVVITLPHTAVMLDASVEFVDDSTGAVYMGATRVSMGGSTSMEVFSIGASGLLASLTSTAPFTWAADDEIRIAGTYETQAA